ncbi:hypothetical protein AB0M83_03840 [Amycolatopsis sp. NPDC051106]
MGSAGAVAARAEAARATVDVDQAATRCDELAVRYEAIIHIAAIDEWL